MTLNVIITQEFIINIDVEVYKRVISSNMSAKEICLYIKKEIDTNQIYWNALRTGKTDIEVAVEDFKGSQ